MSSTSTCEHQRYQWKDHVCSFSGCSTLLFSWHLWHLFTRSLVDVCPAEDNTEATTHVDKVELASTPPTECEPLEQVTPSSTDVEPSSERRDLESPVSQPIIQQPGPQAPVVLTATTDQVKQSRKLFYLIFLHTMASYSGCPESVFV